MNEKSPLQFSKKLQVGKVPALAIILFFCILWKYLFNEDPPIPIIVAVAIAVGFGDTGYNINSAIEKKALAEADADKFEAELANSHNGPGDC